MVHFTTSHSHSSTGSLPLLYQSISLFKAICFLISVYAMSVRRSKAMPTDGPTAKFLYTIIKQLDLKSVGILSHKPKSRS